MLCDCARSQLCRTCLAGAFDNLRGVAACRGEVWAMDVARRCGFVRAWPASAKAHDIAARKVSDLGSDPVLVAKLAEVTAHWAQRWWSRAALADQQP